MSREGGIRLHWPGRTPAAAPATPVALREWERHGHGRDTVVYGDNLEVLHALAAEHAGTVSLVYLDPPYATGQRFEARPRRERGVVARGVPAFDDRWAGDLAGYLTMMEPRLRLLHTLLHPEGSLYLHVDPRASHVLRVLLDEIFGPECFQREIVWRIGWVSGFKSRARNWVRNHDTILYYTKDPRRFTFHKAWVPHPEGYARRKGAPARAPGVAIDDVWNAGSADLALGGAASLDSIQIRSFSQEKTGFATQKNESLLERIVLASSSPGDLVLDPFAGSGTTAVVAQRHGRRFLAVDASARAVATMRRRLLHAGSSQGGAGTNGGFRILCARVLPEPASGRHGVRAAMMGRGVRLELRDTDDVEGWMVAAAGDAGEPLRPLAQAFRPPAGGELPRALGPLRMNRRGYRVRIVNLAGEAHELHVAAPERR
jgi:DNA modification methylase